MIPFRGPTLCARPRAVNRILVRPSHDLDEQPLHGSATGLPIARPAAKVCYGDDEDPLRLDPIEKAIWKSGDEHPPEPRSEAATDLRVFEDPLIRALDCRDEGEAETLGSILEIARRRDEFRFGLGMELDASHRRVERAFSNT